MLQEKPTYWKYKEYKNRGNYPDCELVEISSLMVCWKIIY